jgi:hypothetical protein
LILIAKAEALTYLTPKNTKARRKAGLFLSISSLTIQGEIVGKIGQVSYLWIVWVRKFLSLWGLDKVWRDCPTQAKRGLEWATRVVIMV